MCCAEEYVLLMWGLGTGRVTVPRKCRAYSTPNEEFLHSLHGLTRTCAARSIPGNDIAHTSPHAYASSMRMQSNVPPARRRRAALGGLRRAPVLVMQDLQSHREMPLGSRGAAPEPVAVAPSSCRGT